MGISLAHQTQTFLLSCLIGIGMGAFYDVFRISRALFKLPTLLVFVEDLLFFISCAIFTFVFMLRDNMGEVRYFIVVGEFLGGALYYFTVGTVVLGLSLKIAALLRKLCRIVYQFLISPILFILGKIWNFLLLPVRYLDRLLKKIFLQSKLNLKRQSILLYNLTNSKNGIGKTKKCKIKGEEEKSGD